MRKKFGLKTIYIALVMAIVIIFSDLCVYAEPTIDELTGDRDETQEDLDEVNATIEELAAEQGEIEDQISEITNALVQVMADIEVLENEMDIKQVEIDEAEAAYNVAVEKETAQYEAMKVRIRYLYECGETDIVTIYLESGSLSEALTKAEFVEDLYEYDRKMLTTYQETVAEVAALQEQLMNEKAEMEELLHSYEEEQESMEAVVAELQAVSDSYASEIIEAQRLAREYAAKIEQQNAEISRLQEEARRAAEEEARRAAEAAEAARKAAEEAARAQAVQVEDTGTATVTTTNNVSYDATSIYTSSGSDLGKSLASFACQFVGNPYVAGGTSLTEGADCSGFVYSVYQNFGYSVPRTSYALRSAGYEVSYSEAQPGDVICYPGHVAIYIGNGMIVHASTARTGIKISNAEYRDITCVRRLL